MHQPFYLSCRNGFIHVAVADGHDLFTCQFSLGQTMAALDQGKDICLEMSAEGGGLVQLFTDVDRLLLAMSSRQKLC